MKKTRFLALGLSLSLLITLAAFATGCGNNSGGSGGGSGGSAPAELPKLELSLALFDPATSPMARALGAWADEVYEKTDGGLKITIFASASLCPANETLGFVMDGSADIGWIFTMYFANQFNLTEVVSLPMNGPTHPVQVAEVLWDLYESTPELRAELDSKLKILHMYGNPPNFISTTKSWGPILNYEDIKGLKLRSPVGGMTEVLKAWGASPEGVPPTECYDALSKGNIQGTSWEWHGLEAFKVYEHLHYYMEGMPTYEGVFILGMNREKYDSLPQEYKDVLDQLSGRERSISFGQSFFDAYLNSKEVILAAVPDAEIITPNPEAIAQFKAVADEYAKGWAEKNSTSTFDAQTYLEKAQAAAEKYQR